MTGRIRRPTLAPLLPSRRLLQRLGLVALPLLIAALVGAAFWAPETKHANARAAVVNLDKPVTIRGQIVPLGRQVADGLVHSGNDSPYTWEVTAAADADAGLRDGRFVAAVTIPDDFSARATSVASGDPKLAEQGVLQITTAANSGLMDPETSRRAAQSVLSSLKDDVLRGYLGNVYLGFTTLHADLGEAATASRQLAAGNGDLSRGAGDLARGSGELADGLRRLDTGAASTAAGTAALDTAIVSADRGAHTLADGAGTLASGTGQLATGSARLSAGLNRLQAQASPLPAQADRLATGARQVADGNRKIADVVVPASDQAIEVIDALPSGGDLATTLQELAKRCPESGGSTTLCARLTELAGTAGRNADQLEAARREARTAVVGVRRDITQLADGSEQVATGTAALATGSRRLVAGIDAATAGSRTVADGAARADAGSRRLATGATALSSGLDRIATGSARLTDGARQLAGGAESARAGGNALTTGADQLSSGAARAAQGSRRLATSMTAGLDRIPSYTAAQRERLSEVGASPMVASARTGPSFGYTLACLLLVLGIWLAATIKQLVTADAPRDLVASRVPTWRITLASLRSQALVTLAVGVPAALLVAVLTHRDVGESIALLGVTLLIGSALAVVVRALVAAFGHVGRHLAALVMALTLAVNLTASIPEPIAAARSLLPTQAALGAVQSLVLGTTGLGSAIAQLTTWLILGLAVTALGIHRGRRVPARALRRPHPAPAVAG